MSKYSFWFLLFVSVVGLAACGGGGGTPSPTPGPTCTPPPGMSVALVYPAPNATSVPDTFNQVVIGTSSAFGDEQSWNIYLQPNGVTGGTLQSVYPPFPTPYAIPAFDNPTYYSSSFVGQTFASETVTVYLENPSTYCAPMTLGNFKTQ